MKGRRSNERRIEKQDRQEKRETMEEENDKTMMKKNNE